jgi:hypothetical protein
MGSGTEATMIQLIAAHLPRPVRGALRDIRSAFEVSSFAYLLRNASDLAPAPEPQPVLAS